MDTQSQQQRLGSSTGRERTGGLCGIARAASLTNPDTRSHDDFSWQTPGSEYGLLTRRLTSRTNSSEANVSVSPHEARWVIDDRERLVDYVEEHGDVALSVPGTYSSFAEEWNLYMSHLDTTNESLAYGITPDTLERALRLLSGGGRYKASRYTVIACREYPWLLTGPNGTLLCALDSMDDISLDDISNVEEHYTQITDADGQQPFKIACENAAVVNGVERVFSILPDSIQSYEGVKSNRSGVFHRFTLESASKPLFSTDESKPTWEVSADIFARVGNSYRSFEALKSDVASRYELKDISPPSTTIGEITSDGLHVGYELYDVVENSEHYLGCRSLFLKPGSYLGRAGIKERESLWVVSPTRYTRKE